MQEPEDEAAKAKHPSYGRQICPHGDGDLRSFLLYHPSMERVPLTTDDQFLQAVNEESAVADNSVPDRNFDGSFEEIPIEIQQGINEAHNVVFNNLLRFMIFKKHHEDCENGPGGRQLATSGSSPQ